MEQESHKQAKETLHKHIYKLEFAERSENPSSVGCIISIPVSNQRLHCT